MAKSDPPVDIKDTDKDNTTLVDKDVNDDRDEPAAQDVGLAFIETIFSFLK